MIPPPPTVTLFPYTTLFRSPPRRDLEVLRGQPPHRAQQLLRLQRRGERVPLRGGRRHRAPPDRAGHPVRRDPLLAGPDAAADALSARPGAEALGAHRRRSEERTSELQS